MSTTSDFDMGFQGTSCHARKWGRLKFSNTPPPLGALAFETGTPQAGRWQSLEGIGVNMSHVMI